MPGRFGRKPLLGEQINWSHPLSKGLVGAWLFNEGSGGKISDLSGHRNHGTLTNMVPSDDWVAGRDGWALDFDGDNDYVSLSNTMQTVSAMSVCVWFKVTTFDIFFQALVIKGESNDWRLSRSSTTNVLNFDGLGANNVIGNINVNDGNWHFAVAVHDASRLELYIDGILDNSAAPGTIISQSLGPFEIGRNPGSTARLWDGAIDYVALYSRALTAEEITSLYTNQYAMFEKSPYGRIYTPSTVGASFVSPNKLLSGKYPHLRM